MPEYRRMPDHRDPMTREEVEGMIENATPLRNKALISMLYLTGARISEILAIKKKQIIVREDEVAIKIRPLKRKDKGPLAHRHSLIFKKDAPFMKYLLQWQEEKEDEEKLFDFSRVTAWRTIKKLNEDTCPHFFRHTRLSQLADRGVTGIQLRDWSGRKTIPLKYIESSEETLRKIGRKIE